MSELKTDNLRKSIREQNNLFSLKEETREAYCMMFFALMFSLMADTDIFLGGSTLALLFIGSKSMVRAKNTNNRALTNLNENLTAISSISLLGTAGYFFSGFESILYGTFFLSLILSIRNFNTLEDIKIFKCDTEEFCTVEQQQNTNTKTEPETAKEYENTYNK